MIYIRGEGESSRKRLTWNSWGIFTSTDMIGSRIRGEALGNAVEMNKKDWQSCNQKCCRFSCRLSV